MDKLLLALILATQVLFLSACGNGTEEDNSDTAPDSDGDEDGLTYQEETEVYFTSPKLADTDGDGISDGDEVNELGFNPASNLYRFNPLIADLPAIGITVETVPDLVLRYTDTVGSENTISNSSGGEKVVTDTSSFTEGISVTLGVEVEGGFFKGSVTSKAETTASFEATQEHSTENHETWETVTENSSSTSRETDSATLRIGVSIENISNLTYSLEHLSLVANYYDGNALKPIATLGYDNSGGGFQRTSFAPGEKSSVLLFSFDNLDLGTALDVLKDMRAMVIEPALFELTGEDGVPIDFDEGEVDAKTATVLVDYGIVRPQERYKVSMLGSLGAGSLTVKQILTDILQMPVNDAATLQTIRDVGGDVASRWVVVLTHNDGFIDGTTVFDPDSSSFDIATIEIFPGDELSVIYLTDVDGDGIGIREEALNGTDPNKKDTDGDGLDDNIEIRTSILVNAINLDNPDRYPAFVRSNPVLADADDDGLDDFEERQRGLDPNNGDTDADGISDFNDNFNGQVPIAADFSVTPVANDSFNIAGMATPKNGTRIISIAVNWGDGSVDDTILSTTSLPLSINRTHVYAASGGDSDVYTVTVTMTSTDDDVTTADTVILHTGSIEIFKENTLGSFDFASGWREDKHIRGVVDLDDDGDLDLIGFGAGGVVASLWNEVSQQFDTVTTWISGIYGSDVAGGGYTRNAHPRLVIDYDGDGLDDIIGFAENGVFWSRNCPGEAQFKAASACGDASNTTTFETLSSGFGVNTGWDQTNDLRAIADVDGNGFPDIVGIGSQKIFVARNNGNVTTTEIDATVNFLPGTGFTENFGWNNVDFYRFIVDINNDGRADIIAFGGSVAHYTLGQSDATFGVIGEICDSSVPCISFNQGWRPGSHPVFIEDVNNDDLPDIVGFGAGGVIVFLNESVGDNIAFSNVKTWSANYGTNSGWQVALNKNPRFLADVNADGYKDIVGFTGGVAASFNQLPDGIEAFSVSVAQLTANIRVDANWLSGGLFNSRYAADYNNDGRADAVGFSNSGVIAQRTPVIEQPTEQ